MTFGITILSRQNDIQINYTEQNDTKLNDTQQNNTQWNTVQNGTRHNTQWVHNQQNGTCQYGQLTDCSVIVYLLLFCVC